MRPVASDGLFNRLLATAGPDGSVRRRVSSTPPFQVMPFVREASQDFMTAATTDSVRRIGVAVFPASGDNNKGNDYSGPAATRISLSTNGLPRLVSMTFDGQGRRNDKEAKESLRFPKSGWTYTSIWTAFIEARKQLFDNSPAAYRNYKKVVLLITDGAPERNKRGRGGFRSRPTYLSALYAQELKNLGATILGVGFSSNFVNKFDECHPLCDGDPKPQHAASLCHLGFATFSSPPAHARANAASIERSTANVAPSLGANFSAHSP